MLLFPPASRAVAVRAVAAAVALLVVVVTAAVALTGATGVVRGATPDVADAVRRTVAAGSARIDATYEPARGPTVAIRGRASFVGPESEVSASVGGEPPSTVRVTAAGAWLRPPGAVSWTPVPVEHVAAAGAARGWADLLRRVHASSDVRTDAEGRIVALRLPRDRAGGRLHVRLSEFGTEVLVGVPP